MDEDVEVVLAVLRAVEERDREALLALLHEDVEFHDAGSLPYGGVARGKAEARGRHGPRRRGSEPGAAAADAGRAADGAAGGGKQRRRGGGRVPASRREPGRRAHRPPGTGPLRGPRRQARAGADVPLRHRRADRLPRPRSGRQVHGARGIPGRSSNSRTRSRSRAGTCRAARGAPASTPRRRAPPSASRTSPARGRSPCRPHEFPVSVDRVVHGRHPRTSLPVRRRDRHVEVRVDDAPGQLRAFVLGHAALASSSNKRVTTIGSTGAISAASMDRASGQPAASIRLPAAAAS